MALPLPEDDNSSDRPDWLVGADEGLDAELQRKAREAAGPPPEIKLVRPQLDTTGGSKAEAPSAPTPAPALSRPASDASGDPLELTMDPASDAGTGGAEAPRLVAGSKPRPEKPAAPPKPVAWSAAASSVPTLRGKQARPPLPQAPARDSDGDDDFAPRPAPARPRAMDDEPPARSREPIERAPLEADDDAFLDNDHDVARVAAQAARVAAPREAWWIVAADALRTDRKLQFLIALLVVAFVTYAAWPRGEKTLAIGKLVRNADTFDGQRVYVRGKVGQVFSLGGGYAYYLHQGRDTIVVFTRGARPEWRSTAKVHGMVSTGSLDGVARPAIFADPD